MRALARRVDHGAVGVLQHPLDRFGADFFQVAPAVAGAGFAKRPRRPSV
jgi:hypothetical protein